jgi:hypothetical protein
MKTSQVPLRTYQVLEVIEREGVTHSDVIASECGFRSAKEAAWFIKRHMRDKVKIEKSANWRYNLEFSIKADNEPKPTPPTQIG